MEVCVFSSIITVLCVGLCGKATYTEACTDPVITPASLMVEYGSSAELNCSILNKPEKVYLLGWESKTSQSVTGNETSVLWQVESLTQWEEAEDLQCYLTVGNDQCTGKVNLTLYKKPYRVHLSSVPNAREERSRTELTCEIEDVGPGRLLSVYWNRTDSKHNTFKQFNETSFPDLVNELKFVNKTVNFPVTLSREEDGVQYQCVAVLNLQHGHTLVFPSEPFTITVPPPENIPIWVVVLITSLVVLVLVGCGFYYRHKRMGQYILQQLRSHGNKGYTDNNAEDQGEL